MKDIGKAAALGVESGKAILGERELVVSAGATFVVNASDWRPWATSEA